MGSVPVFLRGARAAVSGEAGHFHRAVRAGRRDGYYGAHGGGEALAEVGAIGGGGEPRRSGRGDRHRRGDEGEAGRHHAVNSECRHHVDQPGALSEAALRRGPGLRADLAHLRAAVRADGEPEVRAELGAGAGGLRQGESGEGDVRELGPGRLAAPHGGAVPAPHGHEDDARAVQGRRAGDDRP